MQHQTLAEPQTVSAPRLDPKARAFLLGIVLATIAPIVVFAAASGPLREISAATTAANAAWLFGTAHVALTGFLWFDRRYRDHIQTRPLYFYAWPGAIAAAGVGAVLTVGSAGFATFEVAFSAWLLHHFGRQNWGVVCLAAAGTKAGPAPLIERRLCEWAPIAALPGVPDIATALAEMGAAEDLRLVGQAATLGIALATAALCIWHTAAGAHPLRIAATAIAGLMFLPIYLLPDRGLQAVGTAHAYQYALIIGYLAASRHEASVRLWTLPLAALSLVYIGAFLAMTHTDFGAAGPAVLVAWQAVIVWHFLVDADVWRLSRPFQRRAVRESLPFIFR